MVCSRLIGAGHGSPQSAEEVCAKATKQRSERHDFEARDAPEYAQSIVQSALLKRLGDRTAFELNLYVDSEQFSEGVPRLQQSRLRELHSAGARVYLCKGQARQGSYHIKAAVVDRRFLYTGSANFTGKSLANEELTFKLVGPDVLTVLQRMVQHRRTGKLWNGV